MRKERIKEENLKNDSKELIEKSLYGIIVCGLFNLARFNY